MQVRQRPQRVDALLVRLLQVMLMETKIVTWKEKGLIKEALLSGKVVAFPTETVYGLGVLSSSEKAYEALREAKNRPAEKPISLM